MTEFEREFEAISREMGTCVIVLDRDGRVLYLNAETLRLCINEPAEPKDFIGKNIADLGYPDEWVAERLGLVARVVDSGEECILRSIWNGYQQFSWMRSLECEEGDVGQVLFVTRRIDAGDEADRLLRSEELPVVQSEFVGIGELSVLSKREIEVLALIGRGLMAREIAVLLHRSVKTIENHRVSIGLKLQKSNKVELALMARAAGLVVDDAFRKRVSKGLPVST